MFPLDFPLRTLSRAKKGDWVLDPFCGRGSTNYAARLLGLPSLGIDANPVAAAIAEAKLVHTTPSAILRCAEEILDQNKGRAAVPKGDFWERCFHPQTLRQIGKIRAALLSDCRSDVRKALRALMLGRLHGPRTKVAPPSYLSNQMPRTFAPKPAYALRYWRKRRLFAPQVDVIELIGRTAPRYFGNLPAGVAGQVVCADSRSAPLAFFLKTLTECENHPRIRWVVTSPPYLGMRTYISDQWLRYWFLGGPDAVEYSANDQIGSASRETFASSLSATWRNAASVCSKNARMIVRFGGIPSENVDPREILYQSFREADCGWHVLTARSSGKAAPGKRQAAQFITAPKDEVEEYDVFLQLR